MGKGCYCKDTNTYHVDCCDGSLWAQGIGRTQTSELNVILLETGEMLLQEDNDKILL